MLRLAPLAAGLLLAGCGGGSEAPGNNMSREQVASEQRSVRVSPGEWEMTTQVVSIDAPEIPIELMQRMQDRRTSARHCITSEQASDPNLLSRRMQQQGGNCEVRNFTMRAGRMEGETVCFAGTPQEVRSRTSGRFGPDSYDYQMIAVTPAPVEGGAVNVTMRIQGRRLGECPADGGTGQ